MKSLVPLCFAAVTVPLFAQTGPSADYVPAGGAYYYNGTTYLPVTTTGTAGPPADNQPAIGLWGYNATTKKWYPCGPSNTCLGAGGSGGGGVTTFNNRSGAVTPQSGDYTASQIGGLAPSATTDTTNATNITSGGLQAIPVGSVTPSTGSFTNLTANLLTFPTQTTNAYGINWGDLNLYRLASGALRMDGNIVGELGFTLTNYNNSAGADTYMRVQYNGSPTASTGFYAFGPGRTPSGMVQPSSSYISSASGLTNGLYLNSETSAPVVLGYNNAAKAQTSSVGFTVLGSTTTNQVIASGATPTIAAGAGAGTSPGSFTITGTNMAGVITTTSGTSTTTGAVYATVTFNGTLGTAPQGCVLQPRNSGGAANYSTVFTTAPSTTTWTITTGSVAPAASTPMSWSYICM